MARETCGGQKRRPPSVKSGSAGLGRPRVTSAISETWGTVCQLKRKGSSEAAMSCHHHPQLTKPGLLQHHDQDHRAQPHRQRRQIHLCQVEQQVERPQHAIAEFTAVSREISELSQDDQ